MDELSSIVTDLWRLAATILVFAMQAGFLLLEAGSVRSKNSVNVAQKNVTDLALCWAFFMIVGYSLAFGLPSPLWSVAGETSVFDFMFQLGFCGAAATIVAGAIAERMSFVAYVCLTVVVAAIIYPLAVWLCWGALLVPERSAPLAELGFVDFAGATVVHVLAAGVALAAIVQLGPRIGRFDDAGKPRTIPGHTPVLSMLGVLILTIGWFGFNAGGLAPNAPEFSQALLNTATAGCFGALSGLLLGYRMDGGVFNPNRTSFGLLGGLVAITACAGFAETWQAALLGMTGGAFSLITAHVVLHRLRLDDPLDVVAVHGVPGVLGTVSVAVMLPDEMLSGLSRLQQLGVQLLGTLIVAALAFTLAWWALRAISRFVVLRVSPEDEHLGLNYTEHGVSVDTQRLKRAIDTQLVSDSFSGAVQVDSDIYDEAGEVAESLNALLVRNEEARKTIAQQVTRFEHFARTTSDYLWETDANLRLRMFSSSAAAGVGDSVRTDGSVYLFDALVGSDVDRADNERRVQRHEPLLTFRARLDRGASIGLRILSVSGVPYFDEQGMLMGYRGGASDVTERQLAEERAHYLAYHDDLTGLGNRRALRDALAKRLQAVSEGRKVIVACIDLDGFKDVNDTYGHATGDKLLEAVAYRIRAVLRSSDDIYRTGGDEFIAVLEGFEGAAGRKNAARWCGRIVAALKEPLAIDEQSVFVGASVGISLYPDDATGQEDLVRMADIAMYHAKVNGKNQVVPFQTPMDDEAKTRRDLESALHEAFVRREFFMNYQPKINIKSGEIMGFEALIRWRHPERGVLAPADFLPAIERLNLISELGDYVLHESCLFAATWRQNGIHIAVNISPVHLADPQFLATVDHALANSRLAPEQLEIEITEDALIRDFELTRGVLDQLHERGISIAIDDFGRGHTSLRYLQQIPLDKLKIDKSFIRNIASNDKAREIARSVVKLGHDLGLSVVAEGVEEQAQLDELSDWECDEAQGYLFSRPVPGPQASVMLDELESMPRSDTL
ncbi:MAG: EAL domain-containing protein [Pseudomonadales bacterium]